MSGRMFHPFKVKAKDISKLHALLRRGKTEQRVAQRARILLNRHVQEHVDTVADQIECDRATVWRVCHRYAERGLDTLYDASRSGRPREISPPTASATGKPGVQRSG